MVESLIVALRHCYYFNTISSLFSFLLVPAAVYAVAGFLIGVVLMLVLGIFVRSAGRAARLSAALCIPLFIVIFWGSALGGRFFGTLGNAIGHVAMVVVAVTALVVVRRALSVARGVRALPAALAATALLAAGLAVAAMALPYGSPSGPAPDDAINSRSSSIARPNVLLVTLDTVRADRTGYSGYVSRLGPRADGLGTTPRLDRLAGRGVVFTNAIVPEVVTDPSHTSLLTAVPPWEHGVIRNAMPLRRDVLTLAEVLSAAGYSTAAFVSVEHLDGHISHLSRGFRLFVDRGWADRYRHHVGGRVLERHARMLFEHERNAEETASAASRWLADRCRRSGPGLRPGHPFFLWVHIFDPHMPYVNHETGRVFGFGERERFAASEGESTGEERSAGEEMSTGEAAQDAYDSEVRYADSGLGILLDTLDRSGFSSGTVVIVTSDHGEHMQETHVPSENWFAHVDPYDEVCRVPLVMAGPGIAREARVERQVSSMDVAPTILELAGVSTRIGGREGLAGLISEWSRGGAGATTRSGDEAIRPAEPLVILGNPHRGIDHRAVRDGRWKVIERGGLPVEVYDLESDPDERMNIIHDVPDVLTRFAPVFAETPIPEGFCPGEGADAGLDPALREMLEALGYIQ